MSSRVEPSRSERISANLPLLFIIGAVCQYVGASVAVPLFSQLNPAAVAWLRATAAGLVLLALWWPIAARRWPRARGSYPPRRLATAAAFGLITMGMNMAFYLAIDHIDLGVAVAIEFLGPIVVAAAGSRKMSDGVAVVSVLVGVVLLSGASFSGAPLGVLFALVAAGLWAGYIVVGKMVSTGNVHTESAPAGPPWRNGIDDLAIGLSVAGAICAPVVIGITTTISPGELWSWRVLSLGVAVGVLSSAVPYLLDQVVLARLGRSQFALLLALLPLTATVVGAIALAQVPSWTEMCGMVLVVAAIVFTARSSEIDSGAGTG
ncbi:EamA family transporter [Williamsia muralis]|uniref:EamA family transporter n=1 Tax=Williamsia marianensis TaxID=85044 RepID=UPI003F155CCC